MSELDSNRDLLNPTPEVGELLVSEPPPEFRPEERPWTERIAPLWHAFVLVAVLVAFSFGSANSQHKFSHEHGRTVLYALTIGWEWLMVGYILLGIRKRCSLRELVGGRWKSVEQALLDVALGIGVYIAIVAIIYVMATSMGMINPNTMNETKQKIGFLAPTSSLELALFFLLAATAGFCEEVIFRGYLLRQFAFLTRNVYVGVLLQAVVFGAGHAYQGGKRMAIITVEGVVLGLVTLWRRSLRPAMVAHFSQDAITGVGLMVAQKLLK